MIESAPQPTRGERNNNPGNIDFDPRVRWQGQLGLEVPPPGAFYRPRFVRFADPRHGIRAIARELSTYITRDGADTIRKAISRWAPPEDDNDTEAYIGAVAAACGLDPDAPIAVTPGNLAALTTAIIRQENGHCLYDAATIAEAVTLALGT